jgi:hypothetical protein
MTIARSMHRIPRVHQGPVSRPTQLLTSVGNVVQTDLVARAMGIGDRPVEDPGCRRRPRETHPYRIAMSRFVRHFLFAALIACHAAVTLCGPCLHELPGSSHQFGPATNTQRLDAPAKSSTDSADNCLICHFVAQGQLTVAATCERSAPLVAAFVVPELPAVRPLPHHCPSSPRAPPTVHSSLA